MSTLETIKLANSTVRTAIAAVLVGGVGLFGYQGYEIYQGSKLQLETELKTTKASLEHSQAKVTELEADNALKAKKIDRLETSMAMLKVNHRVAELTVPLQQKKPDGTIHSRVSFVETNENGEPIGEHSTFEIEGDMVYLDYLVAKFDDKYVESQDLDRSTAICFFRRIFGENQEPSEGFEIDQVGSRPDVYGRGKEVSEFERQIWSDFWTIANDPEKARELGIRAAHGSAASIQVQEGMRYQLKLRSTGEFTLRPVDGPTFSSRRLSPK